MLELQAFAIPCGDRHVARHADAVSGDLAPDGVEPELGLRFGFHQPRAGSSPRSQTANALLSKLLSAKTALDDL